MDLFPLGFREYYSSMQIVFLWSTGNYQYGQLGLVHPGGDKHGHRLDTL